MRWLNLYNCGVSWPSGLVHQICVLMAESSECEFESWLRPWCLCPWARHFTIIASLHPGENGYLWGQSWLLCLISHMRRNGSNWAVYSPGSWDGFKNDLWAWWAVVIIHLNARYYYICPVTQRVVGINIHSVIITHRDVKISTGMSFPSSCLVWSII